VLKVGFAAANSHDIIPIDRCPILDPGLRGALDAAWAIAEPLISIAKPLDIQITATDSGLDVDVRGSGPLPATMIAHCRASPSNIGLARLTRHGELVLMRTPPTIAIGAARVTLPPGSFLQATVAGEAALAALVTGHCKRAKHVADLFCGVGPFALRLAAKARIAAFDSDAGAVTALQKAATATSGLKPIKAEARDLFRRPLDAAGAARLRRRRVRSAAPGRAGASPATRSQQNSDRGRGILQRRDFRPRRPDSDRWRLRNRRRDPGRPVPPHPACRAGGAVQAVKRNDRNQVRRRRPGGCGGSRQRAERDRPKRSRRPDIISQVTPIADKLARPQKLWIWMLQSMRQTRNPVQRLSHRGNVPQLR
jgi:hypothetical protein